MMELARIERSVERDADRSAWSWGARGLFEDDARTRSADTGERLDLVGNEREQVVFGHGFDDGDDIGLLHGIEVANLSEHLSRSASTRQDRHVGSDHATYGLIR